jgi:hypothetical protein
MMRASFSESKLPSIGIAAAVSGCHSASDSVGPQSGDKIGLNAGTLVISRAADKVVICHRTGSALGFNPITISEWAEPAHRAHGDAAVGEALPDDPSLEFDAACTPVRRLTVSAGYNSSCGCGTGEIVCWGFPGDGMPRRRPDHLSRSTLAARMAVH